MKNEKYNKVIGLLRRSKPDLHGSSDIEAKVLSSVTETKPSRRSSMAEYIFGWIEIGWLRTSLGCATFVLLGFFVWQQHNIVSEMEALKARVGSGATIFTGGDALERRLIIYGKTGGWIDGISREDVLMLLDSLKAVSSRYDELVNMIQNDPELIKKIEKSLDKKQRVKPNL